MSLFTFIMSSPEIGEAIEQFPGVTITEAWKLWAPSASDWILSQLPDAGMTRENLITEILQEKAIPIKNLNRVWLADLFPDDCPEVIQVVIVGS